MKVAVILTLTYQPHTREEPMPISLPSLTDISWGVRFLLSKERMKPTSTMAHFLLETNLKFNFAKVPATTRYEH